MLRSVNEESAEETRKEHIVQSAISTLSYSELEAIIHIFDELDGTEGILVASKIADRVGITRSVIVNALRKFVNIAFGNASSTVPSSSITSSLVKSAPSSISSLSSNHR